jgi:hypothetical protein
MKCSRGVGLLSVATINTLDFLVRLWKTLEGYKQRDEEEDEGSNGCRNTYSKQQLVELSRELRNKRAMRRQEERTQPIQQTQWY